MPKKCRLDVHLTVCGLCSDIADAQAQIMAGNVVSDNQKLTKPGLMIKTDTPLRLLHRLPYVSRGAMKLEGAHKIFKFIIKDRVAIDLGISTGGFTDYLIKNGARAVFGIDVGYGQVAMSLQNADNVIILERTNARTLTREMLENAEVRVDKADQGWSRCIDLAVIDVSFISIQKLMPALLSLLMPTSDIICLVKPQFEADKNEVPEGGVIEDKTLRDQIVSRIVTQLVTMYPLNVKSICESPISGAKGNKEVLVWLSKNDGSSADCC